MSVCACDRSRSIAWYDGLVVGIRAHGFMWWSGGVMPEERHAVVAVSRRPHSRCRGRPRHPDLTAWRTGAADLAERGHGRSAVAVSRRFARLVSKPPSTRRKQPPSQPDWRVVQGRHHRAPSLRLDSLNSRAPLITKLISHPTSTRQWKPCCGRKWERCCHWCPTRASQRGCFETGGKARKRWERMAGCRKSFLPPVVSGRVNRQANDLQGETMRGEASCPWGDSPGAGAISRGRRRSAQKYLCSHLGTLANSFVRWPLAACVRRGESI